MIETMPTRVALRTEIRNPKKNDFQTEPKIDGLRRFHAIALSSVTSCVDSSLSSVEQASINLT